MGCNGSPHPVLGNQGRGKENLRRHGLPPEHAALRRNAGQHRRVFVPVKLRLQQCYRRQLEIARSERREETGFVGPAAAFVGIHIGIDKDRIERRGIGIVLRG